MIYITGDCHADFHRFDKNRFTEQSKMTKADTVIILGDFGGVWNYRGESSTEKYWLDWLDKKPFQTVFIDGNHENMDRLSHFPVKEWNGGKVHEIRSTVLHLMRGEIFTIEGKKFFAFGGASSHDISDGILDPVKDKEKIKEWSQDYFKMFRVLGQSWWSQELPSKEEMENGWKNLESNNNKVDFIITHCASSSTVDFIGEGLYTQDCLTEYLEQIKQKVEYQMHFFGHYHGNCRINEKEIMLYEQIIRIV